MKTVRQRKDELLNAIRVKKMEPITESRVNLFEEYKKILFSNGIRNEELITAQLNRMIELKLPKATVYSNLKFLTLTRSRLTEEGIPLTHAEQILTVVEFNMNDINEDDDFIGDLALEFAELAVVYHNFFVKPLFVNGKLDRIPQEIVEKFNILPIELPV